MKPSVSIICPTYNHEEYISDAIESFLMQKVDFPIEIIIHDDASTDNTVNIIKRYEKKYPDLIKPIYQKENQYSKGKIPAHFVYKKATGKYIAICEGDDYWTDPYKLQKQFNFLELYPEYIAVTHNVKMINEHNEQINDKMNLYRLFKEHRYTLKDAEDHKLPFQTASLFYRNIWLNLDTEIFQAYLQCNCNGDTKIAVLLTMMGDIFCMSDIMAVYRRIVSSGDSWSARTYGENMSLYHYNTAIELNKFAKKAFGIELNNRKYRLNIVVNSIAKLAYKPNKENYEAVKNIFKISEESKTEIMKLLFLRGIKKITKEVKNIFKSQG